MKYNDEDTLIRVIKQYYELGISQKEIAEKEYISRSTVNRLINRAVSEGYVKIRLNYPLEAHREFSVRLADAFGVEAVVVPTYVDDYVLRLRDVGRALITDLLKIVQNDDILAISWGRTIEYVARLLEDFQNTKKGIRVVQSNGCIAGNMEYIRSSEIIGLFHSFFGADGYILPVPVNLDKKEVAEALMHESKVEPIMTLARQAQVSMFTVGSFPNESIHAERGLLSQKDIDDIAKSGAVGDIMSRYFDYEGNLVCEDLAARTMGLSFEELKAKKHRMAIVVGTSKSRALIGALRTGVINRLYTDEKTANSILAENDRQQS